MARLPTPGADDGVWGDILNDFLLRSHNSDGSLKTSQIQAAGAELTSNKGVANGYAGLGGDGKVPASQLPSGSSGTLSSQSDVAISGPANGQVLTYDNISSKWENQNPAVVSVASKTGVVTLVKSDVGLGNADNTSDANKPVSTAQQSALDGKVDKSTVTTKGDILAATASATVARLGVGSNGQVLTADSLQTTGVKWATPTTTNTHSIVSKSANYTATTSDEIILVSASGGGVTITLPTAVGNTNQYTVKKTDSSGNTVTLATTSSQTIDGGTTAVLRVQYASISVVSDNSNWYII